MRRQDGSGSVLGGATHQGGEIMSRIALVAALIVLVAVPVSVLRGGKSVQSGRSVVVNAKCKVGQAGCPGSCADPVGDVKGGPGPDITRVTELQWGAIVFQVTFAKAPALAHNAAFTDVVSVAIASTHATINHDKVTTDHYILSLSANDLTREVLRRLPDGKPQALRSGWPRGGKSVTLVVNLRSLRNPSLVRYRVKASRVMLDGTPGSGDYVPNSGTMEWQGWYLAPTQQ